MYNIKSIYLLSLCFIIVCKCDCGIGLSACGAACYDPTQFQCYNGTYLCRSGDLLCGTSCYDARVYTCYGTGICFTADPDCPSNYITPCSPGGGTATNCVCGQVQPNPPATTIEYWQSKFPGAFTQTEPFITVIELDPVGNNAPVVRETVSTACVLESPHLYQQYIWIDSSTLNTTYCIDAKCENCYQTIQTFADKEEIISLETSIPLPTKGNAVTLYFTEPDCQGPLLIAAEYTPICYTPDPNDVAPYFELLVCDGDYVYVLESNSPTCLPPVSGGNVTYPVGVCVNNALGVDSVISIIFLCAGC